ncbi:hypothetical protein BXZ70DRAFT_899007 [Cristinia sonorae]|uniref:Uncharacterized protein n=1 Tax=Cristinia sonorae TaxID=1940300 RepID=A0A8K0UGQ3_9AGAR|nr:hypothetical protein BXZ70DRAFT_899007 [Cristinia sonorae]
MAPLPGHGSRARTRAAQPAGAGTDAENAAPPKREWVLPPPPGPTLQQRVEKRERELGLRCSDVSCGLGPTDDDPEPALDVDVTKIPQVGIHRLGNNEQDVCDHRFHLACLVSAERVAGWGDKDVGENGEVEVSCPVCRAVGCVTKQEWDEGVAALA